MVVIFLIFIVVMVWAGQVSRSEPGWLEKLYSPFVGAAMAHRSHQHAKEVARQQAEHAKCAAELSQY